MNNPQIESIKHLVVKSLNYICDRTDTCLGTKNRQKRLHRALKSKQVKPANIFLSSFRQYIVVYI